MSSTIFYFLKQNKNNSDDSKKAQNTTGIRSGPGYRVWTDTELSGCFTKLVLRWFSCAANGLQNSFLNFPLKTQLFLKTKLFSKLNFFPLQGAKNKHTGREPIFQLHAALPPKTYPSYLLPPKTYPP